MPQNFPEVWLGRVRNKIESIALAPWLEGVEELQVPITVVGEGPSEKNIIYVPTSEFEVDLLINNNTYPIEIQQYTDDLIQITLDKYQTKATSIKEDDAIGASYDKIDNATKQHPISITGGKYAKAIHSMCPMGNTDDTPIIQCTGVDDGTGRKRFTYDNLVEVSERAKAKNSICHVVLNNKHWHDILLDRKNFGDKIVNYIKGKPAPEISGLKLFQHTTDMPLLTAALAKKPFGSVREATDKEASVVFNLSKVVKKTGFTRQYYDKPTTLMQQHLVNYRHYFVATPYKNEGIGAIV